MGRFRLTKFFSQGLVFGDLYVFCWSAIWCCMKFWFMFYEFDIVFSFSGNKLVRLGFEGEGLRERVWEEEIVCVFCLWMGKLQMIIPSRVPPKLWKKNRRLLDFRDATCQLISIFEGEIIGQASFIREVDFEYEMYFCKF